MENSDLLAKSKKIEIKAAPEQQQLRNQQPTFRQQLYGRWTEEGSNLSQLKRNQAGARLNTKNRPGEFSLLGAGLSMTFLTAMEDLEADRNQASRDYFAPVLEKAKYLARYSTDDESCAENLARLLSAAMYYLKERGYSLFSGQRNRRRATCQRIVDEISRFLYDAPAVYSKKIKEVIAQKRQNRRLPKNWKQFQKQNIAELRESAIEEKQARDAILSGDTAAELKKRLEMLDMLTGEAMPQNPGRSASPQEKKKYRSRLYKDGLAIVMEYSKLIQYCDELLSREADPENPNLQENAGKLKRYYIRQMRIVESTVGAFLADQRNMEPRTWKEALYRQSRDYREEENDDKLDHAGKRIDLYFGISEILKAAPAEGGIKTGEVFKRATKKALRTILGAEEGHQVGAKVISTLPMELMKKIEVCTPNQFMLIVGGIYDNEEKDQILASYTQMRNAVTRYIQKVEKMKTSNSPADRFSAYIMQDDEYRAMQYVSKHPGRYTEAEVTSAKNRMREIDLNWVDTKPSKQQMIENLRPDIGKIRGLVFPSVRDLNPENFDLQPYVKALASCRYIKSFAELNELELPEEERNVLDSYESAIQKWWPVLSCADSLKRSGAYERLRAKGVDFAANGGLIPGISMQTLLALKNAAANDDERADAAEWEELLNAWRNTHAEDPSMVDDARRKRFEKEHDARSKEEIAKNAKENIAIYQDVLSRAVEAKASQDGVIMQNAALKDHIMSIITSLAILQKKDFLSCKGVFMDLTFAEKAIAGQPLTKEQKEKMKNGLETVITSFSELDLHTLSVEKQEDFTKDLESKYAMIHLGRNIAQLLSLYENQFPEDAEKKEMTELMARSAAMNEVENVYDAMRRTVLEPDSEEAKAAIREYSFGRDKTHDVRKVIEREKDRIEREKEQKRIALEKERQERERLEREKREREEQERLERERQERERVMLEKKKREEEIIKLGETLEKDTKIQEEMENTRKEHRKIYQGWKKDWQKRDLFDLAYDGYKETFYKYLKPIREIKQDAIDAFMEKQEKTEKDFQDLYEKTDRLSRYQTLISSYICVEKEKKEGGDPKYGPLPYFELYDVENIKKLTCVPSGYTDKMLQRAEELKEFDDRLEEQLREVRELHQELREKEAEKVYEKEGKERGEIDDRIKKENAYLHNLILTSQKKTGTAFETLSPEEQKKAAEKEALRYKRFYEEKVRPFYRTYFDTIEKYEHYLEKEKKDSELYRSRKGLLEEQLILLDTLLAGDSEDSIAVRRSEVFWANGTVQQIKNEWIDLQDKLVEEREYLDYCRERDTGVLDKMKEKLFEIGELQFSEGKQEEEKKAAFQKLIETGTELSERRKGNLTANEDYALMRAISDLTDQMIANGLKLEDLTKEQYEELRAKLPLAESKLYIDYISRNRYALKKETNELTDDPNTLMKNCDIRINSALTNEPFEKKISVSGVNRIKNDSLLPGFDGNVYQITIPRPAGHGGEISGFMLQNPGKLKIFNNIRQGGSKNNYLAYKGVCGPSSASHVINQLYGMNISDENRNIHLLDRNDEIRLEYLPARDEKGKILKYNSRKIDLKESGGSNEDGISMLYDHYNIKHELYKRDVQKSKNKKTYVDENGVDLDILKMAEELDKGNVIQLSVNSNLLYAEGEDPRDIPGFLDQQKLHRQDWINGNVYANHWICLCGAVYEFDGWDKLRAEGKAVKKLKGFMMKDTGTGTLEYIPWQDLMAAYRGQYGGGKHYKSNLILDNTVFIVCHKPEYESRVKDKKTVLYLDRLRAAADSLTDTKTVKSFFEKANKGFAPADPKWLEETAKGIDRYQAEKKRYMNIRDDKDSAAIKVAVQTDPFYRKIRQTYEPWVKSFNESSAALKDRIRMETGIVDQILGRTSFSETTSEVTEETTNAYVEEWLSETQKYIAGETKDYDLDRWITGYMEKYEKYLSLYYILEAEVINTLKTINMKEVLSKDERYQKFHNIGKTFMLKYNETVDRIKALVPKEKQALRESFQKTINAHKADVSKLSKKCSAERDKRIKKK